MQHETFGQEFFYVFTSHRCHCQEIAKKHYIVVIKKWGASGCRGSARANLRNLKVIEMHGDKIRVCFSSAPRCAGTSSAFLIVVPIILFRPSDFSIRYQYIGSLPKV